MMKNKNKNSLIRKPSIIAGLGLLLMSPLAAYANFGVLERLTTESSTSHTAYDFSNSIGSVRVAIICFLLVAILDVVVALALYRVLCPINKGLAKLAAWLRAIYAVIFVAAITQLLEISNARGGEAYERYVASNYSTDYILNIENSLNAFYAIWDASLIIFSLHLMVIGYLAYRARFIPRFLGVLLGVAGIGYLIDSFGSLYSSSYDLNIAQFTFVGEVVFMLWLLFKGSRYKSKVYG